MPLACSQSQFVLSKLIYNQYMLGFMNNDFVLLSCNFKYRKSVVSIDWGIEVENLIDDRN